MIFIIISIIFANYYFDTKMKKLILIQNDCSRSGKSTVAAAISNMLKQRGVGFNLCHTDEERMEDPDFFDLVDFDQSQIIELVDSEPVTVIDVATGTAEDLAEIFTKHELDDLLAELDVEITVVIPVVSTEESLEETVRLAETFADGADYVVAMTGKEEKRLAQEDWDASYAAKAMGYLGAIEVEIPAASSALVATLKEQQISMADASSNPGQLPGFAKTEIDGWYEACIANMAIAHDYLLGELASVPEHMLRYTSSYGISSK